MSPTNTKSIAVKALKRACVIFANDLQALPGDAFPKSFGGCARSVADIVYEVNLVNDSIAMEMRREPTPAWPESGWIKAPEGLRSKEAVLHSFEVSSQKILETAESFSPEEFEEALQTEDGETNRFERCRFMTLHLWYHSGQLNFVQTLLGDDGWHWD